MDDNTQGRPPVPGQTGSSRPTRTEPTSQIPTPPTTQMPQAGSSYQASTGATSNYAHVPDEPSFQEPRRGDSGKPGGRPVLAAILGGVVGAALLFGILTFTGALSKGTTVASSSAGQSISINASTTDASVPKAVSAKALPSVVSIYIENTSGYGIGSGVILDTQGHILTNYHVVDGASTIQVNTSDGLSYDATVVGSDESSDLAVIKIDPGSAALTPIEVGDSSALVTGDWVMTIGSPYGLDQSVSAGIVSALYRSTMMASTTGTTIYADLIQTDAAINSGNSGGALVNDQGKLVGINSLVESSSGANAGIGFAIDGNYAIKVANTIIAGKTVEHAYLGVTLQTVTSSNAKVNNLSTDSGAYVTSVVDGSAAATAGLQKGDIITKIDGEQIGSSSAVILAVRKHDVGDTMEITYMRGTAESTVTVTLGSDGGKNLYSNNSSNSNAYGYGNSGSGSGSSSGLGTNGYGSGSGSGSTSSWSSSIYVDENQAVDDGSVTYSA